MKKMLIFLILISFMGTCQAKHIFPEKQYQKHWCNSHGGRTEYMLDDNSRVDCLTDQYAIEFDYASKWAESIGQSLYYGLMTNKTPGIVLIMEDYDKDIKNYNRLELMGMHYGIKVWRMKPEDLH